MTAYEIRDTVLNSATLEGQARTYAVSQESETKEYIIGKKSSFLLQAMPLLAVETPWEILDNSILEIAATPAYRLKA